VAVDRRRIARTTLPDTLFTERALAVSGDGSKLEKAGQGWRLTLQAPPRAAPNVAGFVRWSVGLEDE